MTGMKRALALLIGGVMAVTAGPGEGQAQPAAAGPQPTAGPPPTVLRPQAVQPLPGALDGVLMINDNNPELITAPGILISTFAGQGRGVPEAHLDLPLSGRFDLFSHHVYAGKPDALDSTLWIAVLAQPRGTTPVSVRLLGGSTALSQSLDPSQPGAPFLPLPALLRQGSELVSAGPGSRVAMELLLRQRSALIPERWALQPGSPTVLLMLPLPVRGLDPLLHGRNLQLRLESDAAVDVATLAAFGEGTQPPPLEVWTGLLNGPLSPREHAPTPRGARGAMVYSRVSGVQVGSVWRTRITDPGQPWLSTQRAPISWPIAALDRGSLGTAQVQTAELSRFYPGTAWAAHGNYGVEYDITLPLKNDTDRSQQLQLALESPIKGDQPLGGLRFNSQTARPVMFRGTVEVSGLDGDEGRAAGRQSFHLVLRAGQQGPALGMVTLAPGQRRDLRVRLIYPADATPPQVLSLLPVKQSPDQPAASH
jgi:hypothetical protein